MEHGLEPREGRSREHSEQQGEHDLDERVDEHGNDAQRAADHRLGDAEADREHHQANRVVQRDDGQQQARERALGLVLAHDHQRGGGSRRRGDRAERDGGRRGEDVGAQEMEAEHGEIHQRGGDERLHDADDEGLTARLAQILQPELVADGESDEAHRHVGNGAERGDVLIGGEADARDAEPAEAERSDQHARDQKGGHVGQTPAGEDAGHQQSREQGKGNIEQSVHGRGVLSFMQNALHL